MIITWIPLIITTLLIGIVCLVAIIAVTRYLRDRNKRYDALERYKVKKGFEKKSDCEQELRKLIRDEIIKMIK